MRHHSLSFLFALAMAGFSQITPAAATPTLDGTSLTLNYNYSGFPSTTDTLTVGAGIEVSCTGGGGGNAQVCFFLSAPVQIIDITGLTIHYAYTANPGESGAFSPVPVNGFDFENLNPGGNISGFTLSTTLGGLTESRITFTAHSLVIDMAGVTAGSGGSFDITLHVPEPASVPLFAAALVALLGFRRGTLAFNRG